MEIRYYLQDSPGIWIPGTQSSLHGTTPRYVRMQCDPGGQLRDRANAPWWACGLRCETVQTSGHLACARA